MKLLTFYSVGFVSFSIPNRDVVKISADIVIASSWRNVICSKKLYFTWDLSSLYVRTTAILQILLQTLISQEVYILPNKWELCLSFIKVWYFLFSFKFNILCLGILIYGFSANACQVQAFQIFLAENLSWFPYLQLL